MFCRVILCIFIYASKTLRTLSLYMPIHADLDGEPGDGSAVGDGAPAPHRVRTLRLKAP